MARLAPLLHPWLVFPYLEYHEQGIRAYNLEPGLVASESMIAVMGEISAEKWEFARRWHRARRRNSLALRNKIPLAQ